MLGTTGNFFYIIIPKNFLKTFMLHINGNFDKKLKKSFATKNEIVVTLYQLLILFFIDLIQEALCFIL